MSNDD